MTMTNSYLEKLRIKDELRFANSVTPTLKPSRSHSYDTLPSARTNGLERRTLPPIPDALMPVIAEAALGNKVPLANRYWLVFLPASRHSTT